MKSNTAMNIHSPPKDWWRRETKGGEEKEKEGKPIEKVELDMGGKVAFILYNVLTPAECEHLIKCTEDIGYKGMPGYSPSYRSNTRVIIDDYALTEEMWRRVAPHVPASFAESRTGRQWMPYGLNSRWRFCRHEIVLQCKVAK